ncbi:hypothetical protein DL95DRAFT_418857 [Leptodontidium sp. 2 PMI_412]|nr:hypothetical protein DL95DRAFT_418857 [Leptodontidium sp. 2 PMI_412]
MDAFESWNTSVEYRLASFVDTQPDAPLSTRNLVEATRITALLWMCSGLWEFPLSTSLVCNNAQKLVNTLEQCDINLWCGNALSADLVLWILVIGACCLPNPGKSRTSLVGFPFPTSMPEDIFLLTSRKQDCATNSLDPLHGEPPPLIFGEEPLTDYTGAEEEDVGASRGHSALFENLRRKRGFVAKPDLGVDEEDDQESGTDK